MRFPFIKQSARGPLKHVLLALADRAFDNGENAFPSKARIARECEFVSERTVDVYLSWLQALGTTCEQEPPTPQRPRTWMLNLDVIAFYVDWDLDLRARRDNGSSFKLHRRIIDELKRDEVLRPLLEPAFVDAVMAPARPAEGSKVQGEGSKVQAEGSKVQGVGSSVVAPEPFNGPLNDPSEPAAAAAPQQKEIPSTHDFPSRKPPRKKQLRIGSMDYNLQQARRNRQEGIA